MITATKELKKNLVSYLSSNFFWNLGRTVPHAILTIYLIDLGVSLERIAYLQIVYMITMMLLEFPSGIISDYWSRKGMFVLSVSLILAAYYFIYISKGNFYLLLIGWLLYGASSAIKSGTLESELINEINMSNWSIKKFSVWDSYVLSISSCLGAIIGSLFYENIHANIYIISFVSFFLSLIFTVFFSVKKRESIHSIKKLEPFNFKHLKITLLHYFKNPVLLEILILFSVVAFFIQPLFQYWQVLYKEKQIAIYYFGYVYLIFQICNMIGTYVFQSINYKRKYSYIILVLIYALSIITLSLLKGIIFFGALPVILCLFYLYYQYLLMKLRENSPVESISTFHSLLGTMENISSIIVLFFISIFLKYFSIETMYIYLFFIFSILSILVLFFINKNAFMDQKSQNITRHRIM